MNEREAIEEGGSKPSQLTKAEAPCYESALRMLSRRDHSISELRKKLEVRKFETDVIDRVITLFLDKNWLDDERFAEGVLRYRKERGYGPFYIRQALMAKGVSRDVADEVIDVNDSIWHEKAVELLRAQMRTGERGHSRFSKDDAESDGERANDYDDWVKLTQKLSGKLQRRGFSSETIMSALSIIRDEQK